MGFNSLTSPSVALTVFFPTEMDKSPWFGVDTGLWNQDAVAPRNVSGPVGEASSLRLLFEASCRDPEGTWRMKANDG